MTVLPVAAVPGVCRTHRTSLVSAGQVIQVLSRNESYCFDAEISVSFICRLSA